MTLTDVHKEILRTAFGAPGYCVSGNTHRFSQTEEGRALMPLCERLSLPVFKKRLKELAVDGYLWQQGRNGMYQLTNKGVQHIFTPTT